MSFVKVFKEMNIKKINLIKIHNRKQLKTLILKIFKYWMTPFVVMIAKN